MMLLHFCDEQDVPTNTTSLEHNSIPCCCDDVCLVQALSRIDENGRFQEVPTDILHHP